MFGRGGLTPDEKMSKAKIQLQEEQPFWAYLIMKMHFIEDKDCKFIPKNNKSMGVDARGKLYWHPDFVKSLSETELKGVLAHEVGHLMLSHLSRCGIRHPIKWNIATDIAINHILIQNNFSLPKKGIIPQNGSIKLPLGPMKIIEIKDLDGKNSEQIYEEIPTPKSKGGKKGKKGKGGGKGDKGKGNKKGDNGEPEDSDGDGFEQMQGFDHHIHGKDLTQSEKDILEKEWKDNLIDAAVYSKQRGKTPAGMSHIIDEILNPQLNWKQLLKRHIKSFLPYDTSFSRPNKKFLSNQILLPGNIKESIDIICHIDTSGSISDKELQTFVSECYGMATSHNNINMTLIECDCTIQQVIEVNSRNLSKLTNIEVKGRGGTSHTPVVDWIKENKPNAKLLVTLTDGYSDIEYCFPELRSNKLILLTKHSVEEDSMKEFGEVFKLK